MDQHIKTWIGTVIILIVAVTASFFVWQYEKDHPIGDGQSGQNLPINKKSGQVACSMIAKQCPDGSYVSQTGPNCEFAACPAVVGMPDEPTIASPKSDDIISSPVSVSGQARGGWFFEASFPIQVYDSNDRLLGSGSAKFVPKNANDTWMTNDFVDFQGGVQFSQPATDSGYILFKNDNPSGDPAKDESFKLSVKFGQNIDTSSWQTYRNDKYGFEFQYPKGFVITSHSGEDEIVIAEGEDGHWMYDIKIENNSDNSTLEKIAEERTDGKMVSNIVLGGYPAKRHSIKNYGDYGNAWVISVVGRSIFTVYGDDSSISNKSHFEALLSTFKFTN